MEASNAGQIALREALELLDSQPAVAARSLGDIDDPRAVTALLDLLNHADAGTRHEAAMSLGRLRATPAVGPLVRLLADDDTSVWSSACIALAEIRTPEALSALEGIVPTLEARLYSGWEQSAKAVGACYSLVAIWTETAISALRRLRGASGGPSDILQVLDTALRQFGRELG